MKYSILHGRTEIRNLSSSLIARECEHVFWNSLIMHKASFESHGYSLIPGKEQIQTRVIRYPNTRVRISKHMCLEINFQKNAVLEQMFIDFQDYNNHSLQLTLTFTLQFKNIPEFNWSKIPRTLLSPSKSSLLVLVVSVTLLEVQGPSSLDTLR